MTSASIHVTARSTGAAGLGPTRLRPSVPARRGSSVYTAGEDFGPNASVILLDYQFCMSHFGGCADVVGTSIVAGGSRRTIVGVRPAGFTMEGVRGSFYVPYGRSRG
jgi:hypothetical protein